MDLPKGLKKKEKPKKSQSHRNRGMKFESILIDLFEQLEKEDVLFMQKIPTDWVVQGRGNRIVSAFPKAKSICDFLGCNNKGEAIAIEAKSTKTNTSFAFSNISDHQYRFFDKWCKMSRGYYAIYFSELKEMYLCEAMHFAKEKQMIDRKSFPYEWFQDPDNAIRINNIDDLRSFFLA